MSVWLQTQWRTLSLWHVVLIPISWLFGAIVFIRKYLYQQGWLSSYRLAAPVIVVGNINVGGTGKTPLVIWLAEQLRQEGFSPGIISRGYGGSLSQVTEVFANSNPEAVSYTHLDVYKRQYHFIGHIRPWKSACGRLNGSINYR